MIHYNGTFQTAPRALRFLADHDRPNGGEQHFNAMHLLQLANEIESFAKPRPIAEYSQDMGDVLWWKFPITEPPYVGSPNDLGQPFDVTVKTHAMPDGCVPLRGYIGGWPGYHTHFTPIPIPVTP